MEKHTLTEYCTIYNRTELLGEWDYEMNGNNTPDTSNPYSKNKAYWKCKKGHSWAAMITDRTSGMHGCLYCTGKKVLIGYNDFASLYPDIAIQWHSTKNGSLKPDEFTVGPPKKVWWQCERGHVWYATIERRCYNLSGCPVCAKTVGERTLMKYKKLMEKLLSELQSDAQNKGNTKK